MGIEVGGVLFVLLVVWFEEMVSVGCRVLLLVMAWTYNEREGMKVVGV